ncbi:MAG TPA: hypothetical protein VGB28_02060 [Actinomycetota bacterium]
MPRLILVLLLASTGPACGGPDQPPTPRGPFEGLLTAVDTAGGRVKAFTVATPKGEVEILIDRAREYGFDLAHLNEHLELQQPVLVTVETKGDGLYAVRIDDA